MVRYIGFAAVFCSSFAITLYLMDNGVEAALAPVFIIAGL